MALTTTAQAQSIFTPPPPVLSSPPNVNTSNPNRGWEGLAQTLDQLTPNVNTDARRSGTEISADIEQLINQGQAEKALEMIEAREALLANSTVPGTDVQLMFQKARALNALKQTAAAQAIYQKMTFRYPELAEPWNNLAVLYVQQGQLEQALEALKNAEMNNPADPSTQANLNDVQLLIKLRDYRQAAQRGVPGAAQHLKSLENLLVSK